MEINKQLFEDVLSGKLKGTFIRRDGIKLNSSLLRCGGHIDTRLYAIGFDMYYIYDNDGIVYTCPYNSNLDIIDFIPDTDMKQNELTIEIPDGKIVDWDESKRQNKIVLKDKQLTYEEMCDKLFPKSGTYYYVNNHGNINSASSICNPYISNPNSATTAHQLECILAKNKLATVAVYLNNGWKPSKTDLGHFDAWVLFMTPDKRHIGKTKILDCGHNSNVLFKSKEFAQQAIEILGEKTIKLALEPLGI